MYNDTASALRENVNVVNCLAEKGETHKLFRYFRHPDIQNSLATSFYQFANIHRRVVE